MMTRAGFVRGCLGALMVMVAGITTGCDDTDNEAFYMRFKTNGTQMAYNDQTALNATFVTTGSQRSATFAGVDANTSMTVEALDEVNIAEDIYDGYWTLETHVFGSLITFVDADGVIYASATDNSSDAVVTVTEMTSTTVKGTFTGTLKAEGHPDIVVTSGEFFIPRAAL